MGRGTRPAFGNDIRDRIGSAILHTPYLAAAIALALAAPASAQRLQDDFIIQGSIFFPSVDSSVRVDGNGGQIGTEVDFEGDLGFDRRSTLGAVMLEWRPGDDWVFNAEYYALGRSSQKAIDRELVVGDTVFPVNATVGAGFDSDIYRFTIGNRVFQGETWEVGLAIGLHGTDFSTFIEGEGTVNGVPGQFRSESRSVFAPLPTIGLFAAAEPMKNLYLGARFDWLSLSIDEYSGRLVNTEVTAAYRVHKNIDVGAMWRFVDYRVKVEKDDWKGRVDYRFSGPALFLQIGF
jgi:hypothetical protein